MPASASSSRSTGKRPRSIAPVAGQVLDQQIRHRPHRRANADVGLGFTRELADQEHQRAEPGLQLSVGSAAFELLDDGLVDLPEQHAGLEQVGRDLVEQEIRRHDRAHRIVGGAADGVVDDTELRAKLPGHTRMIDRAQRVLPEAPANGQQRIVLDPDGLVFPEGSDAGTDQVPVDLPGAHIQRGLNVVHAIRTFREHHPADHGLHVMVRQLDVDCEPALKALQRGRAGQHRLSGPNEQKAIAEPLAARFDDLPYDVGTAGVLSDELLHLVENDDGARHLVPGGERILKRGDELVGRDVPRLRKLGAQCLSRCPFAFGEARVRPEQSPGDERTHVEVVQLTPKASTFYLQRGVDPIAESVLPEPEAEARLRKALREVRGLEHDSEQGEPDAVPGSGPERSRRGVQAVASPPEGRDLRQQLPHVVRQPRESAGAGSVLGEGVVRPQEAQHLRQVRLAAAKEAADPRGRLFGLALMVDVGLQDSDQPAAILALADEVLQLETQRSALVGIQGVGHGRNAVVEERDPIRILLVDVPVLHASYTPGSSCKVMGTAR